MGHGSTVNLTHSSTPFLHYLYITSSPPTQTPDWTLQSQQHEFKSRQAIPQYTYWLTILHSGNFRDIPLIEVSVEGISLNKHYRKTKSPITFTVNAQENKAEEPRCQYCDSPMKANILQFTYITPPTQTPEWTPGRFPSSSNIRIDLM